MTREARSDLLAWSLGAVSLVIMGYGASGLSPRPAWIGPVWLSAIPLLALLAPSVQRRLRAVVASRPMSAAIIAGVWAALGVALAAWSAQVAGPRIPLFALLIGLAVYLGVQGAGASWGGWRLIALAIVLALLAGIWDRAFKILVPGDTPIGFTFFTAVALGLFILTAVRPLDSLDVGLAVPGRDLGTVAAGMLVVMAIALPSGFAVNFLVWNPRLSGAGFAAARLLGLVLFVGLPEELLFRGLIQEGLMRLTTSRTGWVVASLIFGVAHVFKKTGLTDAQRHEAIGINWRYGLLATIAGLGYGWVYRKTGKISAAAITHGAVDWIWSGFFGR